MWSRNKLLLSLAISAILPLKAGAQIVSTQAETVVSDSTETTKEQVAKQNDKEAQLGEVVVEGNSKIVKDDKVVYLPTRRQQNAAHNAAGLLFNMMIPQISVNIDDGSVSTLDGSRLLVCIDDRPATQSELMQIRAKDIRRVEYNDHPTGLFASYDRVLNIVMKRYTSGGYVDATARQQFIAPSGQYTIQSSIDSPKGNLLALAGHNYSNTDNAGSSGSASYHLNEDFSKYTHTTENQTDNRADYALLRQTWRGKKSSLLAQGSLSWNKSPWSESLTDISYTTSSYPGSQSASRTYSRSMAPSLYLYHYLTPGTMQQLYWTLTYTYGDSRYRRNYQEATFTPITSDSKSHTHTADLKVGYTKSFKKGNSLSLLLWQLYTNGDADYQGTLASRQKLNSYDILFIPTYNHVFSRKLTLSLQFGFDVNTYRVNTDKRITDLWLRPGLTGRWVPSPTSSLTMAVYGGNTSPQLAAMSDAIQQVSPFEYTQGNPQLKLGKILTGNLSYSRYFKKVSFSAFTNYNGIFNCPALSYTTDGERLVSQFRNIGDFYNVLLGVSASYSPAKWLTLRPNVTYTHTEKTGYAPAHNDAVTYGLSALLVVGGFSISGTYASPVKTLTTESFSKMCAQYGLTLSYKHKSIFFQAGCNQLLNRHKSLHSYFDYGCYSFDYRTVSDAMNRRLWLSLTYSFDFGRKVQRQQAEVSTGSSMILKP
ncbi:MAG: outer membrane beta-barrel protein [Prevotella sp.]|nr:outer membrane beta-barrel protein [Prevotella sp.]